MVLRVLVWQIVVYVYNDRGHLTQCLCKVNVCVLHKFLTEGPFHG